MTQRVSDRQGKKPFDRNIRIVRAPRLPYVTCMATNAILPEADTMKTTAKQTAVPTAARRWQAVLDRDTSLDGTFVFGVSSTGIFCRPSCPAKRPRRENVNFFDHALQAEQPGYRPCLRCRPKAVARNPHSTPVPPTSPTLHPKLDHRPPLTL